MAKKVIGIDLGTTNSVVAVMEGGKPVVIVNQEGKRTTPSVVAFKPDGERLVGELAKRQAVVNSKNTIYSIKRFMGKNFEEAIDDVKRVSYKVVKNNNICAVEIEDKNYTPQEISSMILMKLKKAAEDYLGEAVTDAVITVPAYFNDAQRNATKEAGEIAGLNVLRIINEPTAAALAYGYEKGNSGKIVVFDLGGGTFDISILDVSDGVFEVLATSGDNHLGGDDFDNVIVNWMIEEFLTTEGVDLRRDSRAMQRLREAAEQAKIELSSQQVTEINLPYIIVDPKKGPLNLQMTLTRSKFESLSSELFERIKAPCYEALKSAGISTNDIADVILVGGSTRIPKVQQIAKEIFGREPNKSVNPDEAVALGAAIQAGVLAGDVKDILLLDVVSISLGVETYGGIFTKIIEANTTIPTRKTEVFSTVVDGQSVVEIHVLQGERPMAQYNKSLGRFYLEGIPPAPRGVPQIEVTFDIDANGILTVSAKDKATGKQQSIRIEGSANLSKEEIERLKEEARRYAQEDENRKQEAEKLNALDNFIYQAEKFMKENSEKINDDQKKQLEDALSKAREVRSSKDMAQLDNVIAILQSTLFTISQQMYNSGTQSNGETREVDNSVVDNKNEDNLSESSEANVSEAVYEEIQ
ncbi:MAG: molecular chaperone DnaK [Candidatus Aenigmatarchaeota archaeon]